MCPAPPLFLSPRCTHFVALPAQRARTTRQDLILAASEVETASALCDKWRAEEDAAAAENAQLQVKKEENTAVAPIAARGTRILFLCGCSALHSHWLFPSEVFFFFCFSPWMWFPR